MSVFKTCQMCLTDWETIQAFVEDDSLFVNGYQATLGTPDEGLYLFTHMKPDCGTTLAIKVATFKDLYEGPVRETLNYGKETCPGYCNTVNELRTCNQDCSMRWVRDMLQVLKAHDLSLLEKINKGIPINVL